MNRLKDATSPYLLQHADNPVDWFPWGDEAFAEAARREVPVFLSVGYSSCHWCHVMAHESFEDDEVAAYLNEHFVAVKVDREERPDVDAVYMEAVQALTGRGGWPMSVFLDHEGRPFYGGTYWPRTGRMGMPGFVDVLAAVQDAWSARRNEVDAAAERITSTLAQRDAATAADALDLTIAHDAARMVVDQAWDRDLGGFGGAPKFPNAMTIEWLLDRHVRTGEPEVLEAATHSLDAMARGGIYDHVGGGFARYSTDARWLVPHFEKMLYDNGLLLSAYAKAASITGDERFGRVTLETAEYLIREMQHPDGGFWSATDADSEGEEGRFFVWSAEEFAEVVRGAGADPDRYAAFFGVRPDGNWEGMNILHEPVPRERFCVERGIDPVAFASELGEVRHALYRHRQGRVPPGLDDKILASWNALAIRGLARAGMLVGEPRYVDAARRAATYVEDHLVVDGTLHHSGKDGEVGAAAFLEDLALLAGAYLDLYEATGELRWYERAVAYADDAVSRFADHDGGGYFQTAADAEALYARPKDTWDNATPSGNSVLAEVFARLGAYTADTRWRERSEDVVRLFQENVRRMPTGYGYLLQVAEFLLAVQTEVAVVGRPGPAREELAATVRRRPRVGAVLAVGAPDQRDARLVPLLADRPEVDGRPAAYVCHAFTCERPVTTAEELVALL